MREFAEIADLNAWKNFIDDFLSQYSDREFVFRGQTKNYPFVPRMKRGTDNSAHGDMSLTTFQWEILIRKALEELGLKEKLFPKHKYRLIGMALLQHYGYRSWFIDVSKIPEIALWFALNKHSKETTPILKQEISEFHPCAYVPTSYYVSTNLSEGYFYIIDVTDLDDIYFDLTKYVPEVAKRVHTQNAGALFELDDKQLENLITVRIRLKGDVLKHNLAERYSYNNLFPSFKKDDFYRYLLTLPYFIPTDRLRKHMAPAFPILPIPFYKHDAAEFFDLGSLIKILTIPSFFPVENDMIGGIRFDSQPMCVIRGKEFKFINALQVLLPQYPSKKHYYRFQILESETQTRKFTESQNGQESSEDINTDLSIWPSNNLLIIFALSPLYLPLGETKDEFLPKGLWVVFDEEEIFISRFGFEGLSFVTEAGMHFVKEKNTYCIEPQKDDCSCGNLSLHRSYLNFFLLTSYLIESGRWAISSPCIGHRHLIQKI